MAEENKVENQGGEGGTDAQVNKEPTRSENRYTDLTNKLAEQERTHALQLEEKENARIKAEEEAKTAKFEADMLKQTIKYPHASEYQNDIKTYTEKGLSVEEATTLVLGKNNRLTTSEETQRSSVENLSMGGSSINANLGGKDLSKMTQEEKRVELVKLEEQGDWGIRSGSLFTKK